MRFILALGSALLLSSCVIADFGPSDRYQTDFHYSYPIDANGHVNLETFNGSVEITGWDENKIEISGTKYAASEELRDDLKIDIRHAPDSIDIRTVKPTGRTGNAGARYRINVPRKAMLDRITSSNGSIRVRDVASAAHLKSSNGSIRVENVASDVEARTSNSSIELEQVHGAAVMKTSNGRIRAEDISGPCDAETSNNSIFVRLEGSPATPVRLTTSNGSIDLRMAKPPKNDIRAETRNSSITVHLPADTSAHLKADTSNSSVSSDFDVSAQFHGESNKNRLDGIIGSGGPTIELSTSNGHIRIVKGNGE
jgi:DUF4097 and DUF4098 domain-containing protein YvlB